MKGLRAFGVGLGLLLACSGGLANAQPVEQAVEAHRDEIGEIDRRGDAFVHRSSGYVYPAKLGEMPARKTTTFGPRDAQVYYSLDGGINGDAWISLFVYPAVGSLLDEQADVDANIVRAFSAQSIARPAAFDAPPAGVVEGWFDGTIKGIPVVTGERLARISGWSVKVRISIPVAGGPAVIGRAAAALRAIPMSPTGLRQAIDPAPPALSASGIVAVR